VVTNFSNSEVTSVLRLYSSYAGSIEGITKPQFERIPLLQHSPFRERMFDVSDKDSDGSLNLLEFAQLMSTHLKFMIMTMTGGCLLKI
jgi:Ca2+-binding EF-hand superfamily protein